jgi:hypothetical protein
MVNTLVKHKKLKSLGIGCIAKELKASYKVNFGSDDVMTCKKDMVEVIDTSHCKTISFKDFRRMTICNSPDTPDYVIIGNELKHYVGIGWTFQRVVTEDDLKRFPRLVH